MGRRCNRGMIAGLGLASIIGCRWDDSASVPEEAVAEALASACEQSVACPCNGEALEVFGPCSKSFSAWAVEARARGLVYQRGCTEKLLDLAYGHFGPDGVPCSPEPAAYQWASCEDECQVFAGAGGVGEPCENVGRRMSTCAPELLCGVDGLCHEPCDRPFVIQEGRPCGYFANGYLEENCAAGLVCDPATTLCIAATALGQACEPAASTCSPDAWCEPNDKQCVTRLPKGAPCTEHDGCESQVCDQVCLAPDAHVCLHPYF